MSKIFSYSLRLCVSAVVLFAFIGCRSAPADPPALVPAETLVYLETNDLARTLNALTENEIFERLAAGKKDFSAFENVPFAVAVTGFETSEKKVAGEQSILNFKPRFVAVADTRAWQFQAVSLAENQLGEFVNEIYGGEVNLELSDKSGGKWFEWTATDGRKAFAFVQGSLIFFGNDDTAIEKVLAVRRGEAESLARSEKFAAAYEAGKDALAFGYVTADGVAQLAGIAGITAAVETTEDDAPRSFIAGVLPQIVRNSVEEIVWTARATDRGIEDVLRIKTGAEVSKILLSTIQPAENKGQSALEFLPAEVFSVTRYNLQNPLIAWRSLLITAARQTDAVSAGVLTAFSDALFAPYGVADSEKFLSAIGQEIVTARFDAEGEKSVAIVSVTDREQVKKSLSEEFDFKKKPQSYGGAEIWTAQNESSAAFAGDNLILGGKESVLKSIDARGSGQNFAQTGRFRQIADNKAAAVTFSNDTESAEAVVKAIGEPKSGQSLAGVTNYTVETRFTEKGFERRTVSDFGFIGTIIEQFASED